MRCFISHSIQIHGMAAVCSTSGDLPPASSDLTPDSHVPPSQLRLGQPSTANNTVRDFQLYLQATIGLCLFVSRVQI
jgi:hypothetical protein